MALAYHREEMLILTKTYPQPSTKYRETTCVAAVNRQGELRRLFPIPFRLLDGAHQFKRWQWIDASITKAPGDNRPESYRVDVDSITLGNVIDTSNQWAERRQWLNPHLVSDMDALELRRQTQGNTIGLIRPTSLVNLEIDTVTESDWTEKEWRNLQREGLFDDVSVRSRPPLGKIPHTFRYRYECIVNGETRQYRHSITDWEVGALYRNCQRSHPNAWESRVRQKLEEEFRQKDLHLLMGTIHKFPHQWLIIGVIYPPKKPERSAGEPEQLALDW